MSDLSSKHVLANVVLSQRFVYRLFANIFANELFVTIINKVVPTSTT